MSFSSTSSSATTRGSAILPRTGGGGSRRSLAEAATNDASDPGELSSHLPKDRQNRQQWLQEQLADRKKRRDQELAERALEVQQLHQRLWSPFVREAARTHELNIAWKHELGFFTWDRVLVLHELEALRITGHTLLALPEELCAALPNLTCLSLIASNLERLPESIGLLTSLTELDLTKNALQRLPDALTTLPNLRHLNLSSNALEALPEAFGDLRLLDKIWLENNRLRELPASIGRARARVLNVNNNRLTTLPDAIGDLTTLTSLSVNMNELVELPDALTRLPGLESLHASRNRLVGLPRNVGHLTSLRELRLDWNQIRELPFSFRHLTSLRVLCMERNPLKLPPAEYVAKGVPATMQYIERALEEFVRKSRREVVEKVQELLAFAMRWMHEATAATPTSTTATAESTEEDKEELATLLALFEPRVERVVHQTERLPFYAVVWESFFEELVPILERRRRAAHATRRLRGEYVPLLAFCTPEEVEDALSHYDDAFGLAAMPDAADFRRCACIDELELKLHGLRRRKVCIPGQVPYRCHRAARLIRMTMMTQEEAKDQMASTYLRRKIARLVAKTKHKCVEFINSEAGVEHFEKLARAQGRELHQRRKRLKKLRGQFDKDIARLEKKKHALIVKLEAFQKAKATRLQGLREKLAKLQGELAAVVAKGPGDKKVARLEEKIAKVEAELGVEPVEDQKILEVELAIEGLENSKAQVTATMERARAKEEGGDKDEKGEPSEDGEASDGGNDSGEEGGGPEDDDDDDGEEEEEDDEEDEEDEATEEKKADNGANATNKADNEDGTPRRFFDIAMPDLRVDDYRRAATKAIVLGLGGAPAGAPEPNEEELMVLYQQHLRDAYVAQKCALVEKKATYEFLQMRDVLRRWMGLGVRAVFEGWRDVARENRANADKVREKLERKRAIEAQNRALAEELARVEARKWVRRVDMYTDAEYFEQVETGVTSWTPPPYWAEEQQRMRADNGNGNGDGIRLPPL